MIVRKDILKWRHKKISRNYFIQKPVKGSVFLLLSCLAFIFIYHPLKLHESPHLNFEGTMVVYFLIATIVMLLTILTLKRTNYFNDSCGWNIQKELSCTFIIMFVTGISVYFTGFLVEEHSNRWNINTFMDSVIRSSLIFIVPFSISFIFNYRRALIPQLENSSEFSPDFNDNQPDSLITIVSQLKKENLVFYASQLIYAESDGNYVTFYLDESQHLRKEIVRNSMNNIEQQLSHIPFYMRTHRSFIVNLRKIKQNKGNALGYLVRLNGCDAEIPVSRQKIHDFKLQLNLFR